MKGKRDSVSKILIIKGVAGLGDRLFSLATGLLYAQLSDRAVFVDWRDENYGNQGLNMFELLFDLHNIVSVSSINNQESVTPQVWERQVEVPLSILLRKMGMLSQWDRNEIINRFSVDISTVNHPENLAVFCLDLDIHRLRNAMTSHREFAHTQKMSDDEIRKHVINTHISLKSDLQKAVDQFVLSHMDKPVIGVHIRKTNEQGVISFNLTKYFRQIHRIQHKHPESKIYLATDNQQVLNSFIDKYGAALITYEKWFNAPGKPLHRKVINGQDPIRVLQDAVIEIYILSKCDYLVIPGNSGFSNYAYLISGLPDENLIILAKYTKIMALVRRISDKFRTQYVKRFIRELKKIIGRIQRSTKGI